ncbi:hypothetical protein SacmaDRAFT_3055 [Saccharomonospora marina XMU15]|uniref:Uncharacterized protein n=1 Tax=Saccharomonospora marina XMU15 TaxID=882083 RepID=H5X6R8_9PSEU|nr:hypothetical protein [Saccharomonospora marina]EHR51291.1 hypothetical protein SacmaDRAFT_3055 [Saccharomonospora marina XMU15]
MTQEVHHGRSTQELRMQRAQKLHDADAVCAAAARTVAALDDTLGAEYRTRVQAAMREVRTAVKCEDAERARQRAEVLLTVLREAGGS